MPSRLECGRPIVEIEIKENRGECVWHAVVGVQVELLVYQAETQQLEEQVVKIRDIAVYADRDLILDEQDGEVCKSELAALIGVEDLRYNMPGQSILQRLDTERGLHSDGEKKRQQEQRERVEQGGEIDKTFRDRDIGDVHSAQLVRQQDLHAAQQIGIELCKG